MQIVINIDERTLNQSAKVEVAAPNCYKVGDIVSFDLTTGEHVEMMAMEQNGDYMTFCFVDCLREESNMHNMNEFLRKVEAALPADILEKAERWSDGAVLRLSTEKEIFGKNKYGYDEPAYVKQWEPMKLRRNRIAFQGYNGDWEWYWLSNRDKNSASRFADVGYGGICTADGASDSGGVRPAIRIKNK